MHIYARIRQAVCSIIMANIPDRQILMEGKDSSRKIATVFREKKISHILLATTAGTIKRGMLAGILDDLKAEGIEVSVFTEITPDPTDENVMDCAGFYTANHCEAILAVGGGSVIDCAKAAGALIVNPSKTIKDISGTLRVKKKIPFFAAVPTTAGTGSEVTAGAVITGTVNGRHFKHPISDPHLMPDVAVLDPVFSLTMSKQLTAYTGMDALSHAVEAYTNRFAFPVTRKEALEAVRLIFANLKTAYDHGSDLQARTYMLKASCLAGRAIEHNYIGYVHALSHAIGGLYGLPHGYINAILMPVVLKKYGSSVEKKLNVLAKEAGVDDFIQGLYDLNTYFGIPDHMEELRESDFEDIMEQAMEEAHPAYPVPVIWNIEDFTEVLRSVKG